jgi:hypothetical protein
MKKTAVEFYAENAMKLEIERLHGKISTEQMLNKLSSVLIESKEMEKQQIIEAHGDKQKTKSNPDSIVTYGYTYTGKDYYNDKYEK